MSRTQKLLVVSLIISISALACATLTGGSGNVLFEDNFSRTSTGWDRVQTEEAITDYGDDVYQMKVMAENDWTLAGPYLEFSDTIIEVDTFKASGGDDNGFGIFCRYEEVGDDITFYFLEISSDGYIWIGKYFNDEYEILDSNESSQINLGNATNKLRAECVGNHLALYVNGSLELETIDSDLSKGEIGLVVETYDTPLTEILFDNFVVTKP